MANTKIEWATKVWNPISGCTKVSPGCDNCYAERTAKQRLAGRCGYPADDPFKVILHPDRIEKPYDWKKPQRIFVNSMGDLFHEDVPDDYIWKVFETMANAQWFHGHKLMVLTKRPERMKRIIEAIKLDIEEQRKPVKLPDGRTRHKMTFAFPLQNIWLGVSVENQEVADERIPILLQTPAAVRFVSAEPMLGPIVLRRKAFNEYEIIQATLMGRLKEYNRPVERGIDWVICGNATGTGMPTIEPFHSICINHYMRHGFQYFGMITVVTDVVRENNQTYRLGWTEQCKDGTKMGVGCPEYILLFRKLPTDRSKAYADVPVSKTKEEYTRAQWQIDAHGFWRSSGNRFLSKEELAKIPIEKLQAVYRQYSRENVYDYQEHVELAKKLDKDGRLPASFMVVAPGSWHDEVWDDINRMRTLNTSQSQKRLQMHVCPLQLDIAERIINRYSNPGEVVFDPFAGLFTVPERAVRMGRKGYGIELNTDYFRDGVGYLRAAESAVDMPTLFDFITEGVG